MDLEYSDGYLPKEGEELIFQGTEKDPEKCFVLAKSKERVFFNITETWTLCSSEGRFYTLYKDDIIKSCSPIVSSGNKVIIFFAVMLIIWLSIVFVSFLQAMGITCIY